MLLWKKKHLQRKTNITHFVFQEAPRYFDILHSSDLQADSAVLSATAGSGEATRRAPSQPLRCSQQVLHLHLFSQTQTSQEMLVPTQARQSCPPSPLGIDQDLSSLQVNPDSSTPALFAAESWTLALGMLKVTESRLKYTKSPLMLTFFNWKTVLSQSAYFSPSKPWLGSSLVKKAVMRHSSIQSVQRWQHTIILAPYTAMQMPKQRQKFFWGYSSFSSLTLEAMGTSEKQGLLFKM